eukprot:6264206-Amphidinium_carterae.1
MPCIDMSQGSFPLVEASSLALWQMRQMPCGGFAALGPTYMARSYHVEQSTWGSWLRFCSSHDDYGCLLAMCYVVNHVRPLLAAHLTARGISGLIDHQIAGAKRQSRTGGVFLLGGPPQ